MSRHPYPDFRPTFENRLVALSMLFSGALMAALGGLLAWRVISRSHVLILDSGMMVQPTEPLFLAACAAIALTLMGAGGVIIRSAFQLSAADRAERHLLKAQSQAEKLLANLPVPDSFKQDSFKPDSFKSADQKLPTTKGVDAKPADRAQDQTRAA
ncbi:MAG: hypothetical protein Alpg2KO_26780 [Alphaproteobacteria bacterium]